MDFDKTVELYERAGLLKKWQENPESYVHESEKKWYEKVKSKRTGDFYQADDLIKRELVPPEWTPPHVDSKGKPLKYPIKSISEIYRIRIADGSEWLKSRQMWTGLNDAGSPIDQSMNDKELYDDILPIYTVKPENPRARDSKMIREVTSIEHRKKYTLPFTPENLDKLYAMRNGRCWLVLKDETVDKPPYSIPKLTSFRDSAFEELFQWASTPRTAMDRSYGDSLEASHIG